VASATELGLLWGGGREDGERNALQQLLANYASDRALHTVQRASCMALRQAYRQDALDAASLTLPDCGELLDRLHAKGGLVEVLCSLPSQHSKSTAQGGALPYEGLARAAGAEPLPKGIEGEGFAVRHYGAAVAYTHLGKHARG